MWPKEAETVIKLHLISTITHGEIPDAILQGWQGRLCKSDHLLAVTGIASAIDLGVSPDQLSSALKELSFGDIAAGKQHFLRSHVHYRRAWKQSTRLAAKIDAL